MPILLVDCAAALSHGAAHLQVSLNYITPLIKFEMGADDVPKEGLVQRGGHFKGL